MLFGHQKENEIDPLKFKNLRNNDTEVLKNINFLKIIKKYGSHAGVWCNFGAPEQNLLGLICGTEFKNIYNIILKRGY